MSDTSTPKSQLEPETKSYTSRFVITYTVLGVVLAGSVVGLIALAVGNPTKATSSGWSTWQPKSGNVTNMTQQISDRIAAQYRTAEDGGQLVAVLPRAAEFIDGNQPVALDVIAIRKAPQSDTGIRVINDTSKTRVYTLCGLGKNCQIKGEATAQRGRLVRREALETALYTFKYVPSVDAIMTFMPPVAGATNLNVLYLEKDALKEQLERPLRNTLPLATPPLPDSENLAEASTIDKLTEKNVFSFELAALQTGGAAIILDPVG
jgi:hypothetical protein